MIMDKSIDGFSGITDWGSAGVGRMELKMGEKI